jgi:hypothetical protein
MGHGAMRTSCAARSSQAARRRGYVPCLRWGRSASTRWRDHGRMRCTWLRPRCAHAAERRRQPQPRRPRGPRWNRVPPNSANTAISSSPQRRSAPRAGRASEDDGPGDSSSAEAADAWPLPDTPVPLRGGRGRGAVVHRPAGARVYDVVHAYCPQLRLPGDQRRVVAIRRGGAAGTRHEAFDLSTSTTRRGRAGAVADMSTPASRGRAGAEPAAHDGHGGLGLRCLTSPRATLIFAMGRTTGTRHQAGLQREPR